VAGEPDRGADRRERRVDPSCGISAGSAVVSNANVWVSAGCPIARPPSFHVPRSATGRNLKSKGFRPSNGPSEGLLPWLPRTGSVLVHPAGGRPCPSRSRTPPTRSIGSICEIEKTPFQAFREAVFAVHSSGVRAVLCRGNRLIAVPLRRCADSGGFGAFGAGVFMVCLGDGANIRG
jgi:hypothetical protein